MFFFALDFQTNINYAKKKTLKYNFHPYGLELFDAGGIYSPVVV